MDGEIEFPKLSPAIQLKNALVLFLKENVPFAVDVKESQIRGQWDVSGEITQPAGIYVSAKDLGGHNGLPGRILVDVELSAVAWSHLNEDADGAECDQIASCIQERLEHFHPEIEGWAVRYISSWDAGEIANQDAFRTCEIKATLFLQNLNY